MPSILHSEHYTTMSGEQMVKVTTRPCVVCDKIHTFTMSADDYNRWIGGENIQKVFPEMSVADREILISGTCDECFQILFPPEDDEQ